MSCGESILITQSLIASFLAFVPMAERPAPLPIWTGKPPGEVKELEAEKSITGGRSVADKPVTRITNVSIPALDVYIPEKPNGAAMVICPGGGHQILAWDLEGTEVAQWLNKLGVTAFVLKYRVPARSAETRYRAAVQDAQRAVSLVRSKATDWKVDPRRIGILGFSAGGETAALATLFEERLYDASDAIDKEPFRADFALLVYPAYLSNRDGTALQPHIKVPKSCPPFLLIHAADDPVTADSSILLCQALRRSKVSAELHVYSKGGHGYGLRPTDFPVTKWTSLAEDWLKPFLKTP